MPGAPDAYWVIMFLSELSWPKVQQLSKDLPVIIPVAAVEQHGHHLPLVTDSALLGEIVQRVANRLPDDALIAPLMWLGNSDHHLDFNGTLSCPPRVYLDLLVGLVNNVLHHGFRRILLLNGHGGNDVPGKQAIFEVRQQWRERNDFLLLFTTYWSLGSRPWESIPDLEQREMGHACEWETSMMLRISPDLVGDYQSAQVVEPGNPFLPASRAWVTQDRSKPGHIGKPHLATVEKGEGLFQSFSQDAVQLIQRMQRWDGRSWEG
jgi:creatinine amidohydrolase